MSSLWSLNTEDRLPYHLITKLIVTFMNTSPGIKKHGGNQNNEKPSPSNCSKSLTNTCSKFSVKKHDSTLIVTSRNEKDKLRMPWIWQQIVKSFIVTSSNEKAKLRMQRICHPNNYWFFTAYTDSYPGVTYGTAIMLTKALGKDEVRPSFPWYTARL